MAVVTGVLREGTQVSIRARDFTWLGDEPTGAGGTDTGPDPYELLLSSLAACICLTIAMYCKHKKLSLQSVRASLDFARIHADDCKDCEMPDRGFIEQITSNIHISGDFDDAQKKRLAQIAQRCPVHKTLAHGIAFEDNATFD